MDISMPGMDGVELCATMKDKYPGIFILGLSSFNQGLYIKKMMENGASGYILKNSSREDLLKAIHTATDGGIYFSGEVGEALKEYQRSSRTPIAADLAPGEGDLRPYCGRIYQHADRRKIIPQLVHRRQPPENLLAKLDVKNTACLIKLAVERKLI